MDLIRIRLNDVLGEHYSTNSIWIGRLQFQKTRIEQAVLMDTS